MACGDFGGGMIAASDGGSDGPIAADVAPCMPCPIWTVACGGQCVDLTSSPENCGGCGVACDTRTQQCQGGVCVAAPRCAAVDAGTAAPSETAPPGLRGEYYGDESLAGMRFVRIDAQVSFDWSMAPATASFPMEHYSVQWTGQVTPPSSGTFTFYTTSDDGVRLWVNNRLLIDNWTGHAPTEDSGTIALEGGRPYDIVLQYFQGVAGAVIRLSWSATGIAKQLIPSTQLRASMQGHFACDSGFCCDAGGSEPVCCSVGTRCVNNANFRGCCPLGESCGEPQTCRAPSPSG
jgi:hypothetical protein